MTDRNLPRTGSLASESRPLPRFTQMLMLENFTKSWYDALETQLRTHTSRGDAVQISYTLSRSYLDGVDFFSTQRSTERTPHERGYNPADQRHNLTASGTFQLAWDIRVSGILKLISGSPVKVQAGFDLDGDRSITGDRPPGVPNTVGRERVDESLHAIHALRASLPSGGVPPIDKALLALDPYRTLDARIAKVVRLRGERQLEILIAGFNLTNHVNFRAPIGLPPTAGVSINSRTFLARAVARDARQIQWGVRYIF